MDQHYKKKRYKSLLTDSIAFAISNFASKILIFLLVPLYTAVLSTNDYGIADLITNTVNLLYPILTLSIMEATLRFAFEKDIRKDDVLTNSLFMILAAEIILICCTPIIKFFFTSIWSYWGWFLVIFGSMNLQQVLSQFVKGVGKTKIYAISGIFQTIVIVVSNIIGLLVLKGGLKAYLFSLALSYILTSLFLVIFGKIKIQKWHIDFSLLKEMLKYSSPMIPTIVSWWVSTSADKYVIIAFLGVATSGIYSVAYKIPSVLTLLTNIFTSAWTISAIQSVEDEDKASYQSYVYKLFNSANVLVCAVLIVMSQILGKILFANEFFEAWHCVPFLLVAYVYAGLSGFLASSFRAEKNTKGLLGSALVGAIINIILNLAFVPFLGIRGASITTLIGFAVTFYIRERDIKKIISINIESKKNNIVYVLLFLQSFIMSYEIPGYYIYSSIICIAILVIYINTIRDICKKLISILKMKIRRKTSV